MGSDQFVFLFFQFGTETSSSLNVFFRADRPDGGRARPVFTGVHHPADVGFLRRVRTVAGFLLPRRLENTTTGVKIGHF